MTGPRAGAGLLHRWAVEAYAKRRCLPLGSIEEWDAARRGLDMEIELQEQRRQEVTDV